MCIEPFEADDEIRTLPCGHEFHRSCIDGWFKRRLADRVADTAPRDAMPTCPLCKAVPINEPEKPTQQASGDATRTRAAVRHSRAL